MYRATGIGPAACSNERRRDRVLSQLVVSCLIEREEMEGALTSTVLRRIASSGMASSSLIVRVVSTSRGEEAEDDNRRSATGSNGRLETDRVLAERYVLSDMLNYRG